MRRMEDEEAPSFYKILLPFPQVSQQLRIAPDFVKHIEKELSDRATLKGPSGDCWPVKLHKDEQGIFLIDGWHSFFEAHSLENYEVVVFDYQGKMCFDVKIFGVDGLKRDEVPEKVDSQEVIFLEHDSGSETKNAEEGTSNAKIMKPVKPRKHTLGDSTDLVTGVKDKHYTINDKFSSAFPFFELIMDLKNIKRHERIIPKEFTRIHLLNGEKPMKMTLRNKKGNSWEVDVAWKHPVTSLRAGWIYFVRDNELKPGDRCIFELVKKTEMQVHIFRNH